MAEAIWQGSGGLLRLEAPFIQDTKASVVARGLALQVPYQLTWDRNCPAVFAVPAVTAWPHSTKMALTTL